MDHRRDVLEHVSDEGDDVEACEGFCISLVVFDEAPAARGPGEGSFDDPASWQQDKPALCLWQFHDVQHDILGCGSLCGRFAGVAIRGRLVDVD